MKDWTEFETRDRKRVSFQTDSWSYKERLRRQREKRHRKAALIKAAKEQAEREQFDANLRAGFVEVGRGD